MVVGRSSLASKARRWLMRFDFGEHHHLLASGGRSIVGEHVFQGYLAHQLTL